MNFFFDLINECAGYTEKYYSEIGSGKLTYSQMVKKYRKEKESGDVSTSELLGDHYPHCLMVIEGVEKLFRMYRARSKSHLPVDYLDTLILRLNVSALDANLIFICDRPDAKESGTETTSQ